MKIQSNILLKFISQEKYMEDFLNGDLYMNSLYYFWNEYPQIKAAQTKAEYLRMHPESDPDSVCVKLDSAPNGQMDLFEGTVWTGDAALMGFDNDFAKVLKQDLIFRSVGYQYCNVLSFYRLDYTIENRHAVWKANSSMQAFGEYVAIIDNPKELLQRVRQAVLRENFDFLCGNIEYRHPTRNGIAAKEGHSLTLKADKCWNMMEEPIKSAVHLKSDAFVKTDSYQNQSEWRIALYRGMQDTNAYKLKVGNLRDIVHWVKADQLESELYRIFENKQYTFGVTGWTGTLTREEMREKFYRLGDNMVEILGVVG